MAMEAINAVSPGELSPIVAEQLEAANGGEDTGYIDGGMTGSSPITAPTVPSLGPAEMRPT
jgi:hypothetical protein